MLNVFVTGQTDSALLDWLQTRLDIRRQMTPGRPADNLALVRCVRYRLKTGLSVKIDQVYGMPGMHRDIIDFNLGIVFHHNLYVVFINCLKFF